MAILKKDLGKELKDRLEYYRHKAAYHNVEEALCRRKIKEIEKELKELRDAITINTASSKSSTLCT